MQSQGDFSQIASIERIRDFAGSKWESLTDSQKNLAKKIWGVITYKWRWQIAMNVPYLGIFLLDKTIPAVHDFDMKLLSTVASKLPIPAFISAWIGIG